MKYKGEQIKGPSVDYFIYPRSKFVKGEDGVVREIEQDIVLTLGAVLDFAEFEALCPEPKPPAMLRPGGQRSVNFEDPDYKTAVQKHNTWRFRWMVLQTLAKSPELEWETVDLSDPETWDNWRIELKDAGWTPKQIDVLITKIVTVNTIDEQKMDEARARFLASREGAVAK